MIEKHIARYQAVQITTSSPGEILIALLDGLFRFLLVAKHGLGSGDRARAGQAMSRAHAILAELLTSLDPSQAPELCDNLTGIYNFCLSRITHANRHNDAKAIEEVMRVMTPVREAFTTAVRSLPREPAQATGSTG
jgi:flagellar protein FliS